MNKNETMTKIIKQLLNTGDMEVENLINIYNTQPYVILAAKELANDLGCPIDWGIIIESLATLIKNSIDYGQIEKEVEWKIPEVNSNVVLDEVELLNNYIESIKIDGNMYTWGEIYSSIDSKYEEAGELFKELIKNSINLDEFYGKVSDIMVSIMKSELVQNKLNPIAVYTISNNVSILIYDIDYVEDKILAGVNEEKPDWYNLNKNSFYFGELEISLDECIKI